MNEKMNEVRTTTNPKHYDVIVAGGGTAGWMAALSAARLGKKVLVVERKGYLGGALTTGMPIHGFFNSKKQKVISGIPEEFLQRLRSCGGASEFNLQDLWFTGYVTTNPATIRAVIFEMLFEAGVDILLFGQITRVITEGRSVKGVVVQKRVEQEIIYATSFIDATGDAILCQLADVPTQPIDELQPPTLIFRIENVDVPKLRRHLVEHPEVYMQGRFLPGKGPTKEFFESTRFFYVFQDKIGDIKFSGDYSPLINRFMFSSTPDDQGIVVNMLRALFIDSNKPEDISLASVHLYRNIIALVEAFRKIIPGFERCTLCDSEPEIQLRETKRIIGDYTLLFDEDVVKGKFFDDTVVVGGYFLDIHSSTNSAGTWKFLEYPYGIPYRSFIPGTLDNVLAAGRCISGTREAAGSYRVMGTCMAMGQAAGTAAALAADCGGKVREIGIENLRSRLKADKAILEV